MQPWKSLIALSCLSAAVAYAAVAPPLNLEGAITEQRARLEQQPADAGALNDLGNLLRLAGKNAEAEEAYRQAIETDSERAAPRYNLALLLQDQGKDKAALKELRKVVSLEPNNAWAHYQLGTLYERQKDSDAAVRSYARAFSLNPELALPEVNPQVIDNHLLTSALLEAHSDAAPPAASSAPNSYAEPARVAKMLKPSTVPSAAPSSAPAEEAQLAEQPTRPTATPTRTARAGTEAAPSRVLSEDNLDDRQVGQVKPSSPQGYRPSTTRTQVRQPAGGTSSGGWNYPNQANNSAYGRQPANNQPQPRVVVPGTPGQPRVVQPGAPGQVRPGQQPTFQAGTASTGRATNGFGRPRG